jgi:hypothetical protein
LLQKEETVWCFFAIFGRLSLPQNIAHRKPIQKQSERKMHDMLM